MDDWGTDELLPIVLEVGEVNLKCMAMLDKAEHGDLRKSRTHGGDAHGGKGPFIVISGHDLYDLKLLLSRPKEKVSTSIPTGRCFPPTPIQS